MARSAIVTKVVGHVIVGSGYTFVICLVTAITGRRRAGKSGRVTCNAGGGGMRAGQGERRVVMTETGRCPSGGCVTL